VSWQTVGPIRTHTNGIKVSPDGGYLPASTVMADTGLMAADSNWAVLYECSGAPKTEGNPPVSLDGFGIYVLELYDAAGVVGEPTLVTHEAYSQGGHQSIPGPINIPQAIASDPILIVHKPMTQGGSTSIPPIAFLAGQGLRIRTLVPLRGVLSGHIMIYTT